MRTSLGFGDDSFDDFECDRAANESSFDGLSSGHKAATPGDHLAFESQSDLASGEAEDTLEGSKAVSLKRLFSNATFFQCDDIVAESLSLSPAEITAGDLSIYRTGESDPVEFSALALAQGARGILTDQLLPCPLPQVIVSDVETAACDLMNRLHHHPSKQLMMIGVVGNSGKTTTALMVTGLLRALGIRAAYETDLGSSDGIVQTVEPRSCAKGAELIARMSEASDAGCGAAVIEFTNEVAAAHSGIAFDLLIVTGTSVSSESSENAACHFGPDPLMIALDHLAQDGVVIVPADHPKLLRRVDDAGLKRLSYGLRREADVSAKVFDNQPGEMTLMVSCGDESALMETRHCGEAMAMNQLAAISVALLLESRLHEAVETVSRLPVVPGRMQRVTGFDSAAIVIDAAGDWSRIASTLRTLRQQRGNGKLWCVMTIADGSQVTADESLAISGRMIEKYSDRVVLTSTQDGKPNFLKSAHALLDGFREVTVARLVADQRRAIQWAVDHAAPQDTIVVLGGLTGATAVERRTQIQSLEQLIERCQQSPQVKRYSGPATIPMPGVV